jgi:hypothetical protein
MTKTMKIIVQRTLPFGAAIESVGIGQRPLLLHL